jgi:hypothetical protein
MARHLNLWGAAYSTEGTVQIELDFNEIAVFGDVVTTNATTPTQNTTNAPIFSFELPDEYTDVTEGILVRIKAIGGDIFVAGFGDLDNPDTMFGAEPGQLKTNISYNGGEPYNVTDTDLIAAGVTVAEGSTPGEFHLNCVDSAVVTFDYTLHRPVGDGPAAPEGPYPSWTYDEEADQWNPPVARPADARRNGGDVTYVWNEDGQSWDLPA